MIHTLRTTLFAAVLSLTALTASAQQTTPAPPAAQVSDVSTGNPEAGVKVVEYASFTCPHCARFHAESYAPLKAEYIDTGKIQFTLREVYFDRYGLWAGMMARCGGDMKYFGIVDILYDTQTEWSQSEDPNTVLANLKKIALSAGLDGATIDACMKDGAKAEALVARFEANMTADAVEGTPTFFINGVRYGNMTFPEMKAVIDAELAK